MIVATTMISVKPIWLMFGFEIVIAVATVLGLQFALGRYQDGQGLALACVAGTIAVGSVLGWIGAQRHLTTSHGDISLNAWLLGRLAAALALGAVGAVFVLSRNQRSWWHLIKAALLGGPIVMLAAAYVVKPGAITLAISHLPSRVAGGLGVPG